MATPMRTMLHMQRRAAPVSAATAADLLGPAHEWYEAQVRDLAHKFAGRLRAREFDNTRGIDENAYPPFTAFDDVCGNLPICTTNATARLVVAVSKYAATAPERDWLAETEPNPGDTYRGIAQWCLARDIHDEAIRLGFAKSTRERGRCVVAAREE